jgi:nitronate monooxygenase
MANDLTRQLGIQHPIVLAPLGGESASAALVAAVSNAGGLGILGAAYMSPARIGEVLAEVRSLTNKPFGVNLFCPQAWKRDAAREAAFIDQLARYHAELGMPAPQVPAQFEEDFEKQFEVVLKDAPAVFSFTFGDLGRERIVALQSRGTKAWGTATQVREAVHLAALGVDGIVAQGAEAGAHRGTFMGSRDEGLVGTIALVPQVVDAVKLPVIAAGGIADARGVAAVQALGASAAAAGTAFLLADECPISAAYREALRQGQDHETVMTRAFSGRWARGLENRFMREYAGADLPDFPIPNALTRPLRQAAGKAGRAEFLSLWAGQAVALARRQGAADIVRRLAQGWRAE